MRIGYAVRLSGLILNTGDKNEKEENKAAQFRADARAGIQYSQSFC